MHAAGLLRDDCDKIGPGCYFCSTQMNADNGREGVKKSENSADVTCARVGFLKLGLVKKLRFLGHLWTDLTNFLGDLRP